MVVVKSPRSRETLDRLLGHTNCVLAAEHGAFIRWGKHARWQVRVGLLEYLSVSKSSGFAVNVFHTRVSYVVKVGGGRRRRGKCCSRWRWWWW